MKRRILAIALMVMMILTMLPMNVWAAEESDTHEHVCPGADVTHTKDNCTWEVVETVATECGEDGYTVYKCHVCNAGFVADIVPAKAEHSYADVEGTAVDATCDAAGKEADQKCANCGKVEPGKVIAAGDGEHDWEIVKVTEGKCDEERAAEQKCKDCGATGETTVPAGEHTWGTPVITPAEGEKDGEAVYTCTVDGCGATKTVVIPGTPAVEPEHEHKLTKVEAVEPTCTEDGNIEYYTCECGKLFADDKAANEIELADTVAPAHEYTLVEEVVLEPTCTEPGLKYSAKLCKVCSTVYDNGEVVIEALGHKMEPVAPAVEPGCINPGATEKFACQNPNCEYTEGGEEIKAIGHSEVKVTVAATCYRGAYEFTYCTNDVCELDSRPTYVYDGNTYFVRMDENGNIVRYTTAGKTYTSPRVVSFKVTDETLNPDNHGYNVRTQIKTNATCTQEGLSYTYCYACNNLAPTTAVIPMLEHDFETNKPYEVINPVKNYTDDLDKAKAEICYSEVVKCADCSEIKTIKEHKHDWKFVETVAATCREDGYDFYECSKCDSYYATNITKYEHVKDVVYDTLDEALEVHTSGWTTRRTVRAGTCTIVGTYLYECACGETYFVKIAGTGEHLKSKVVAEEIPATCTEAGKTTVYYCSRTTCRQNWGGEEIAALGHTEEVLKAVAPTCTETGLTEGKKCTVCEEILVAQEVVEALGHTEKVLEGKDVTCEADGLTEGKICTVCEEVLVAQEVIKSEGHNYEGTPIDPKCEEKGFTLHECANCGDSYIDTLVDALGHDMRKDAEASVAAKCEEEGKEVKVCANGCGKTEEKVLEALGHKNADKEVLENKCTNVVKGDRVCVNGCGETIGQAHDEKVTTVDATCAAEGYTLTECSACDLREVEIAAKLECDEKNYVEIPAVEATCAAAGATAGTKCSVCGDVKVEPEEIAKLEKCLDTTWGEWTLVTDSTEFVEGVEKRVCTVCGAEETRAIGVKTAINYTLDIDNAVVAGAGYADSSLVAVKVSLNTAKEFGVWGMKFDVNYDVADVDFVKSEAVSANFINVICNDADGKVSVLATAPNDTDKGLVDIPVNGAEAVIVLYFRINNAAATETEFAVANAEVLNKDAQSMKSEGETETIEIAKFLDVNADAFVNLADALALYQLTLNNGYDVTGDVDKNGAVNLQDLVQLYNYLVYINSYEDMVNLGQ